MAAYWETARRILSGKPRGSKLIVLGVFLAGVGVALQIAFPSAYLLASFWIMGIFAFMRGLNLYERETEIELQQKKNRSTSSS